MLGKGEVSQERLTNIVVFFFFFFLSVEDYPAVLGGNGICSLD